VITIAYGRLLVAAGICGAGLIAGLAIQQPRVKAARADTELAKAQATVDLQAQEVTYLERLVAGERAAREALTKAQERAKEATDEYHREVDRITTVVDGLPRRVSRLCQPPDEASGPATGGGGGAQAGDPSPARGRILRPGDGAAVEPDFDARPWRAYAQRCEEVSAGLRACLK
jgi:hypothetical protein